MISMTDQPNKVDDPRVYLAAERTFLAWVRTSLALMGFGFLIARFAIVFREVDLATETDRHRTGPPTWLGFAMVCFGVVVSFVSASRHRGYIRALESGVTNPPRSANAALILASVLVLVGLAMAVHILTL
jgi:putative membrane protein